MRYHFDKTKHIHYLDNKPLMGTSTVVSVLAKNGLTWWSAGKAVETFGWLHPKKNTKRQITLAVNKGYKAIQKMSKEEYVAHLDKAYRAHSTDLEETSFRGTKLHKTLENWVKKQGKYPKRIESFVVWFKENVKRVLWVEAHCFDAELWIGGISDLGVELMNGEYAVIDFKSSKTAYSSQFLQGALYGYQIEVNGLYNAKGEFIGMIDKPIDKVIIFPFGMKKPKAKIKDMSTYRVGIKPVVTLYNLLREEQHAKN